MLCCFSDGKLFHNGRPLIKVNSVNAILQGDISTDMIYADQALMLLPSWASAALTDLWDEGWV